MNKNIAIVLFCVAGVVILGLIAKFPYPVWVVIDISVILVSVFCGVYLIRNSMHTKRNYKEWKMSLKTKKIIAREGLVVLIIAFVGILCLYLPSVYLTINTFYRRNIIHSRIIWLYPPANLVDVSDGLSFVILLFVYPAYLIARFVLWASRILKQKEEDEQKNTN